MSEISREDLSRALNVETAEVERLRAQNARLLDMLTKLVGYVDDTGLLIADDNADAAVQQARAAIAKAKGGAS